MQNIKESKEICHLFINISRDVIVENININNMSQNPKDQKIDNSKKPKTTQTEKKNTDAWKQKQAIKKKQKQLKQTKQAQGEVPAKDVKQEKKEKKKKNKEGKQAKQEQQHQKDKKIDDKLSTKQQKKVIAKYKKLQTIQSMILPKHPQLFSNKESQVQLIQKQITNLIRAGDTILYFGKNKLEANSKILAGSGRINYRLVQVPGFYSHPQSQIVCRYQDLSYLIAEQVDKVFLQAAVIFQNGSALTTKGYENISVLAQHFKKPVIVVSDSWNYSKQLISSYDQLQKVFGQQIIQKYDWINSQQIDYVCLQFGPVLASQVAYHVEQGYKRYGFATIKW